MELLGNAWSNEDILLYHGTNEESAQGITNKGGSLVYSRPMLDFGQGCYTTTNREQAVKWGIETGLKRGGNGFLVTFTVSRIALAGLESIWFVRNGEDADDLWRFITHCRTTGVDHAKPGYYDIVIGPVATNFRRKVAIPDSDQVSFHTAKALEVLNQGKRESITLG
jgi:hypothetical protein